MRIAILALSFLQGALSFAVDPCPPNECTLGTVILPQGTRCFTSDVIPGLKCEGGAHPELGHCGPTHSTPSHFFYSCPVNVPRINCQPAHQTNASALTAQQVEELRRNAALCEEANRLRQKQITAARASAMQQNQAAPTVTPSTSETLNLQAEARPLVALRARLGALFQDQACKPQHTLFAYSVDGELGSRSSGGGGARSVRPNSEVLEEFKAAGVTLLALSSREVMNADVLGSAFEKGFSVVNAPFASLTGSLSSSSLATSAAGGSPLAATASGSLRERLRDPAPVFAEELWFSQRNELLADLTTAGVFRGGEQFKANAFVDPANGSLAQAGFFGRPEGRGAPKLSTVTGFTEVLADAVREVTGKTDFPADQTRLSAILRYMHGLNSNALEAERAKYLAVQDRLLTKLGGGPNYLKGVLYYGNGVVMTSGQDPGGTLKKILELQGLQDHYTCIVYMHAHTTYPEHMRRRARAVPPSALDPEAQVEHAFSATGKKILLVQARPGWLGK